MGKDFTYDVIVHENHILELCMTSDITVAQAFGESWDAPPCVQYRPVAQAKPEPKKYDWKPVILSVLPSLVVLAIGVLILIWR